MARGPIPEPRSLQAWIKFHIEEFEAGRIVATDPRTDASRICQMNVLIAQNVLTRLDNRDIPNIHYGEARIFIKPIQDAAIAILLSSKEPTQMDVFIVSLAIANDFGLRALQHRYENDIQLLRRSMK